MQLYVYASSMSRGRWCPLQLELAGSLSGGIYTRRWLDTPSQRIMGCIPQDLPPARFSLISWCVMHGQLIFIVSFDLMLVLGFLTLFLPVSIALKASSGTLMNEQSYYSTWCFINWSWRVPQHVLDTSSFAMAYFTIFCRCSHNTTLSKL